MDFRTSINNIDGRERILHSHRIMMLGSCFSDNIGGRLQSALMNVDVNPFGTVYNPASILSEITRISAGAEITADELFQANGMWNHFGFHSQFSRALQEEAFKVMNERLMRAHEHLRDCDVVIVTLGTAMVYEHAGEVVSNCHKLPAREFERRMLGMDEVVKCLRGIVDVVHATSSQAKVIFTVSPIRHVADGLEQNQLSKSILRVAVGAIVSELPNKCAYFPAYEIMMDDLRDYRFYAADMVHPSDVAVEYIWNSFKVAYFDDRTAQMVTRCERLSKRLAHRPMTDNREAIERFRLETAEAVRTLVVEYPYLENLPQLQKYVTL